MPASKDDLANKIRGMLMAVSNIPSPSRDTVEYYIQRLNEYPIHESIQAIDELIMVSTSHISPAHIRNHIRTKISFDATEIGDQPLH